MLGESNISILDACKEEMALGEVRNLNQKLIGAISADKRVLEIQIKDCVTLISVRQDGTLGVTHGKKAAKPPSVKKP